MEARKGALQDLHDPRQHRAYADESEHDDANSPQEVLRRVEQAQQDRPSNVNTVKLTTGSFAVREG